jgi:hypothetical protein
MSRDIGVLLGLGEVQVRQAVINLDLPTMR